MAWREITVDDVFASLGGPLGEAAREELLIVGQDDPLTIVIPSVTAEVREAVATHPRNRVHANPAFVPESSIRHACALIRVDIVERLALGLDVPDSWRNAENDANAWLDKVAQGERAVDDPQDGTNPTDREGCWNSENKILPRTHPVPRPSQQGSGSYANPNGPSDR